MDVSKTKSLVVNVGLSIFSLMSSRIHFGVVDRDKFSWPER